MMGRDQGPDPSLFPRGMLVCGETLGGDTQRLKGPAQWGAGPFPHVWAVFIATRLNNRGHRLSR